MKEESKEAPKEAAKGKKAKGKKKKGLDDSF